MQYPENTRSYDDSCEDYKQLGIHPDIRVAFILLEKFTLAPVSGLVESFRFAADQSFRSLQIYCQWDWMTFKDMTVTASCGLKVLPTTKFDIKTLIKNYDYIVLAGGLLSETRDPPEEFLMVLKEIYDEEIPIIALCSGSFVLGKIGVLNNRKCAVHFSIKDEFVERFPQAIAVIDETYVEDNGIFTCPGGTAIELAATLIRRHCGNIRAQKGLDYLLVDNKSNVNIDNAVIYTNNIVEDAINLMKDNLANHLSLNDIAVQVKTNVRQLHRLFLTNAGQPPAQYWRTLRLKHAKKLLSNTNKYITTIAIECGFSDASHFSLWFKSTYGESPSSYRKRRREVDKSCSR